VDPTLRFKWMGQDERRVVFLYLLAEGSLSDEDARRTLMVQIQEAAALAQSLPALEASMTSLADQASLDVSIFAGPDHTDPYGERVSLGFRPRASAR
jgi:hypothetical protein